MLKRFFALFLGALALPALSIEPPPAAVPRPVQDIYFGVKVDDPFRHFENRDDPEVSRWMRAQADYARAVLDRIPGRAKLAERITTYDDAVSARVVDVQRRPGELYFYEKRGVADNQFKLYVRRGSTVPNGCWSIRRPSPGRPDSRTRSTTSPPRTTAVCLPTASPPAAPRWRKST